MRWKVFVVSSYEILVPPYASRQYRVLAARRSIAHAVPDKTSSTTRSRAVQVSSTTGSRTVLRRGSRVVPGTQRRRAPP
eukprot:429726-Rhodomonas_salina.1